MYGRDSGLLANSDEGRVPSGRCTDVSQPGPVGQLEGAKAEAAKYTGQSAAPEEEEALQEEDAKDGDSDGGARALN